MSGWSGRFHPNLETVLENGRRNSIEILNRIRSGSLPGWKGSQTLNTNNVKKDSEGKRSKTKTNMGENSAAARISRIEENPLLSTDGSKPCATIIPMRKSDDADPKLSKQHGNNNLGLVLSAMYAKLLVVLGIAFPLSEVISTFIPASFYDGFYLYLYFGSITFMICVLGRVIKAKAHKSARNIAKGVHSFKSRLASTKVAIEDTRADENVNHLSSSECSEEFSSDNTPQSPTGTLDSVSKRRREMKNMPCTESVPVTVVREHGYHFGSFYLRMGAVAFGIGSMIYSGLEFSQYFELKDDPKCHNNYMIALTPSVRMIFTFMQMYFIFLNSKMAVSKGSLSLQFGLAHMIGTNLCVWLNVLVQETKHEILHFYDQLYTNNDSTQIRKDNFPFGTDTGKISEQLNGTYTANIIARYRRGLKGPHSMDECGRTNIMGSIVQNAAPFLFPCTIEYSLICAAICYVMWKSMAKRRAARIIRKRYNIAESQQHGNYTRSPHHYTVDCARANKGLFLGIFVLVLTIMSLIINFVFTARPDYKGLGNLEVNITEIVLYTTASVAVLIGMCQMRELRYAKGRNLELDNILLIAAQTGSLIYNIFTIISGQFMTKDGEKLVLITAIAKLIQLLLQTIFILDASKRVVASKEQVKSKPGREVVTFLLVSNLAMWLINALEKSRGESHPGQLRFYGIWGWTIITDISMPMAIFYRFHSTVCLCEIWKKAFKAKRDFKYT